MSRQRDFSHHSPASRASARHRSRSYSPGYRREEGHRAYTSNRHPHANNHDIRQRPTHTTNSRYNIDNYHNQYDKHPQTHRDNGSTQSTNGSHRDHPERFHSYHDDSRGYQSYSMNNRDFDNSNDRRYERTIRTQF